MSETISLVVIASGICSGAVLGAAVSTDTEKEVRRSKIRMMLSNFNSAGVLFSQVLWMFIIILLFTLVVASTLYFGNAYPLSRLDRYTLVISWFVGAGMAKLLRYCYWKCYE